MNRTWNDFQELLIEGQHLSREEMQFAIGRMMDGECSEVEMAAFLTALRMKGETADEIVGAAQAMISRAVSVPVKETTFLLDTCGTGGDKLCTFNISTATAIVCASLGIPVAKHGNRSATSSSGSSTVLETLGVHLHLTPEQVAECIEEVGMGFCFAPLYHGAMKHAAPVRQQLGFRTIFNLLGPLVNPAGANYQILGVSYRPFASMMALALKELGCYRACIVSGADNLDEVSLWGETELHFVDQEVDEIQIETVTADSFGLSECCVEELQVSSPEESAEVLRSLFQGASGPQRDIVLANTAVALRLTERAGDFKEGIALAAQVIDSGETWKLCEHLMEWTNRHAS